MVGLNASMTPTQINIIISHTLVRWKAICKEE